MTDPTLQAYYDVRLYYDITEHLFGNSPPGSVEEASWAEAYGLYKIARYKAVRAGLIPETPQFDVEDERARKRRALRELTRLTEEYGGYEELKEIGR